MYRTCLFCSSALGANQQFEAFPVGRRLAFDGAKGRLWVICPRCVRWNLSPLDIRWEAIEAMERAYRDTRLRAATDQIGLAKLKDGTELVRIGKPLLPEFAAWRYGRLLSQRFTRESRWMWGLNGLAITALGLDFAGVQVPQLLGIMSMYSVVQMVSVTRLLNQRHRPRLPLRLDNGQRLRLTAYNAGLSRLRRDEQGDWYLRLHHADQVPTGRMLRAVGLTHRRSAESTYTNLYGPRVLSDVGRLLPLVNVAGANTKGVAEAVERLVTVRTAEGLLDQASQARLARDGQPMIFSEMDPGLRLALEMALHEADERRALDGELADLEARWREAEEIAGIADNLLLPADIDMRLAELKQPPSANP